MACAKATAAVPTGGEGGHRFVVLLEAGAVGAGAAWAMLVIVEPSVDGGGEAGAEGAGLVYFFLV